ncbi:translocon-associated protein subunit beta [Ochromonadaceae sp. CCMP2298]|nr:translocon-associated protein subunit beta [Ochromonadaceae sp. CCMP2298]
MDFSVNYQIINTGNAAATKIEVSDRYDPNSFETKNNINEEGNVAWELEELAPGAQASFNVTVRPKLYGIYESTRAKIKYGSGVMEVEIEGVEPDFRSGYSTSLGRIKIISSAEHERSISYHLRALSLFGIIYAVPTFIPFLLWLATKSASARISRAKTN